MATLKDIAKKTGVSASTISRVLNDLPEAQSVPDSLRSLIFQTAEELNYVVSGRRKSIGRNNINKVAVVGWFNEERDRDIPFYSLIRRGIESEFRALGLDGSSITFEWSESIRTYSSLLNFDGIIVIGQNHDAEDYFMDKSNRVVFIDYSPNPSRYNSVVTDLAHGCEQALVHLLSLGYESFGYLGGENEDECQLPRYIAFRNFLSQRSLFNPEFVRLSGDWTAEGGYAMAKSCLTQSHIARAYIAANDPMAIGAMNAFLDAGLRVPEDVAIIGFDDIEMSSYVRPALTTVRIPAKILGQFGADLLVNGLSDNSLPIRVTVPTSLIVRESCGHLIQTDLMVNR